jgi:transposase
VSVTERFAIYGFATTHDALTAEAALERAGVAVTTIPAPRELGSHCGLAMRVHEGDAADAEGAMSDAAIAWTSRVDLEDRVPGR